MAGNAHDMLRTVFNFQDVMANLAIYVDCTAPNLTIRSQTKSIGFIYIIPLLVNNLVETTLIYVDDTAGRSV